MNNASRLRCVLAITTALAVTTLGVAGNAAAALEPGKSRGHAHGEADDRGRGKGGPGAPAARSHGQDRGRSAGAPHGPRGHGVASGSGAHPGGKPAHAGRQGQGNPPAHAGRGGRQGHPADPPGNNGTVKITPVGEDDGIPQNTPHAPCGFDVEWYGFDEGPHIVSEVVFESWAPTAVPMSVDGPSEVFVGGDPASGAGTDSGFDGEATYTLGFDGEPHPQQGYHVKLTIHTPGSQGADTKHKVFWVEPCEEQATQPGLDDSSQQFGEQDSTLVEEGEADVLGEQETAPAEETQPDVLGEQETAPAEGELEVLGVQATRGVPTTVAAGVGAAERVGSALALLLVMLGGLATAAGAAFRRRSA